MACDNGTVIGAGPVCEKECSAPTLNYAQTLGNCVAPIASGTSCSMGCAEDYTATTNPSISCTDGALTGSGPVCMKSMSMRSIFFFIETIL